MQQRKHLFNQGISEDIILKFSVCWRAGIRSETEEIN